MFIAGGYEEGKDGGEKIRRTRIPLDEFVAAVRLGSSADGNRVESDEVECLLANMIYKVRPPPSFNLLHRSSILLFSPSILGFSSPHIRSNAHALPVTIHSRELQKNCDNFVQNPCQKIAIFLQRTCHLGFALPLLHCSRQPHYSPVLGQNLMKGYISREKCMVVLSKSGAFPGTGA